MAESGTALKRYAARFTRTYLIALLVIAVLVTSAHLVVRHLVISQSDTAAEMNALGTQQMLSQRMALLLTELSASPGNAALLAETGAAREEFIAGHYMLSTRVESLHTPLGANPNGLSGKIEGVMSTIDRILAQGASSTEFTSAIAMLKGPILADLEKIIAHREAEAEADIIYVLQIATSLAMLTVFALLAEAALIFRPLTRRVRKSANDLIAAHDSLQNSVRRDSLTGLPNRNYLHEHLAITLHNAARQSQAVGICHFDLCGFRRLNERMGHEAGDRVLIHVASVIKAETRRGDFIARVGADEFIVISPHVPDEDGLKWLGKRIAGRMSEPITLDGGVCRITGAVGIAIAPPGATAVRRLLADADLALREAKRCGEPTLCTPTLRNAHDDRLTLRDDLDRGLDRSEIEPWFQPQICARTGAIDGFEALARWRHPEKGLLGPAVFIDAATEFGFGDRLAEAILDKSLSALAAWRKDGLVAPCIGVNFAAEHLSDPFMVEKIKWAVEARSLAPEDICIEILESVLVDDERTDTALNLTALSRAGFRVDLDDFGTGHSSISTLQRFPVDRIKIDRSFITNIDTDIDQQKLTGAMIDLAHSLGVKALAEGVETEGEWSKLAQLGCDHLQGFCIGRPMPSADIAPWTKEWTRRLAATG